MQEHLFPVRRNGKTGYINASGQVVIDFVFNSGGAFSEGLAAASANGKSGYIDAKGDFVLESSLESLGAFSEGFAIVHQGRHLLGYIDKQGTLFSCPNYTYGDDFNGGYARVFNPSDHTTGFIDKSGQIWHPKVKYLISLFREGLINTGEAQQWGFIRIDGSQAIDPAFKFAQPFSEGLAAVIPLKGEDGRVNRKGLYGFINCQGELVIPPKYPSDSYAFSEGLCPVWEEAKKQTRFGYINQAGEMIIELPFGSGSSFSNGVALFRENGTDLHGYINLQGEVVIKPRFDYGEPFRHELAEVRVKQEDGSFLYGYINKSGDYVWEPWK